MMKKTCVAILTVLLLLSFTSVLQIQAKKTQQPADPGVDPLWSATGVNWVSGIVDPYGDYYFLYQNRWATIVLPTPTFPYTGTGEYYEADFDAGEVIYSIETQVDYSLNVTVDFSQMHIVTWVGVIFTDMYGNLCFNVESDGTNVYVNGEIVCSAPAALNVTVEKVGQTLYCCYEWDGSWVLGGVIYISNEDVATCHLADAGAGSGSAPSGYTTVTIGSSIPYPPPPPPTTLNLVDSDVACYALSSGTKLWNDTFYQSNPNDEDEEISDVLTGLTYVYIDFNGMWETANKATGDPIYNFSTQFTNGYGYLQTIYDTHGIEVLLNSWGIAYNAATGALLWNDSSTFKNDEWEVNLGSFLYWYDWNANIMYCVNGYNGQTVWTADMNNFVDNVNSWIQGVMTNNAQTFLVFQVWNGYSNESDFYEFSNPTVNNSTSALLCSIPFGNLGLIYQNLYQVYDNGAFTVWNSSSVSPYPENLVTCFNGEVSSTPMFTGNSNLLESNFGAGLCLCYEPLNASNNNQIEYSQFCAVFDNGSFATINVPMFNNYITVEIMLEGNDNYLVVEYYSSAVTPNGAPDCFAVYTMSSLIEGATLTSSSQTHTVPWTTMMQPNDNDYWNVSASIPYNVILTDSMTTVGSEQYLQVEGLSQGTQSLWTALFQNSTCFLFYTFDNQGNQVDSGQLDCPNGIVTVSVNATSITFYAGLQSIFVSTVASQNLGEIWTTNADGDFNGGELTITVSQGQASIPIPSNIFGNYVVGQYGDDALNWDEYSPFMLSNFTTPSDMNTLTQLSAYIGSYPSGVSPINVKACVYTSTFGFVTSSPEMSVGGLSWYNFTFDTPLSSNTEYWFGIFGSGDFWFQWSGDNSQSHVFAWTDSSLTYPTFPNPFNPAPSYSGNDMLSEYMTYTTSTPSPTPTPSPAPSPTPTPSPSPTPTPTGYYNVTLTPNPTGTLSLGTKVTVTIAVQFGGATITNYVLNVTKDNQLFDVNVTGSFTDTEIVSMQHTYSVSSLIVDNLTVPFTVQSLTVGWSTFGNGNGVIHISGGSPAPHVTLSPSPSKIPKSQGFTSLPPVIQGLILMLVVVVVLAMFAEVTKNVRQRKPKR